MHLRTALAASVSVAALLSTSFAATAQTDLTALYEAAKAEGQLTTIALPHDWCGYGAVIDGFKAKYPEITINELNPDAGSGDEIEAIKANKDNKGPQAPDVIDVGLSFGPSAKADGLLMPYKVSTWDSIPDSAKDADGYWYGDYYGVLAFLVNDDLVATPPKSWADLKKPDYANQFALAGDPHQFADHCFLRPWIGVVELQRVGPAVEIRITAVGQEHVALRTVDPGVVLRRADPIELRHD